MNSKKTDNEIIVEIYRRMYREAEPPADFDKMITSKEVRVPGWFSNYFLPDERQVEIINGVLEENNIKRKSDQRAFKISVLLGCAPSGIKKKEALKTLIEKIKENSGSASALREQVVNWQNVTGFKTPEEFDKAVYEMVKPAEYTYRLMQARIDIDTLIAQREKLRAELETWEEKSLMQACPECKARFMSIQVVRGGASIIKKLRAQVKAQAEALQEIHDNHIAEMRKKEAMKK